MPSLRSCRSPYSPMHGVHQCVDPCNGNVIPFFMQGMFQLGQIGRGIWAPPNPPIQFVQQVFNPGQIWAECWPVERVYVVVSQKLLANSSDMEPGIVMLEDQVTRLHTSWTETWRMISSLCMFIILGQAIKCSFHILRVCTRRFFFVLVYLQIFACYSPTLFIIT